MIYSYNFHSKSAKALAEGLGVKRIKHENSAFVGSDEKVVINWGCSTLPEEVKKCKIVNNPECVGVASNKLKFFEACEGYVNIPEFTTSKEKAMEWVDEKNIVIARTKLSGHSGEGIIVVEGENDFKHLSGNLVKLWVKYIPKKEEYRVHVVRDEVIDVRRKALKKDMPKEFANWKVRNYSNGFIFRKNDIDPPTQVLSEAVKATQHIGLDFGAVDVIWNELYQKAYVLEINTAAGLEGSTVDAYVEAFLKLFDKQSKRKREINAFEYKWAFSSDISPEPTHLNIQYIDTTT